ncbi:hypothetical protein Taro_008118 [Colocasia esculenta]|uniref:Uncharacterized protein n=1 Tax=Colocasia esculenta TaxID=4460 RepID=A0A843U2G1_COLES|nr:hypothetical protein [Colocasia esculenta]
MTSGLMYPSSPNGRTKVLSQYTRSRFKNPEIGIGSVGPKPVRPADPDPGLAEPSRAEPGRVWPSWDCIPNLRMLLGLALALVIEMPLSSPFVHIVDLRFVLPSLAYSHDVDLE